MKIILTENLYLIFVIFLRLENLFRTIILFIKRQISIFRISVERSRNNFDIGLKRHFRLDITRH